MYIPHYALFFDFHTSPVIRGVGSRFSPAAFADAIAECGADFITFPARCNMGMAYYDTKIGIRHYGLDFDLFGGLVKACGERGIKVCAYFNGGISEEETRLHPEWMAHPSDPLPFGTCSPFLRTACGNTGYREHLVAMTREVAMKYPVAGFFIDCMAGKDCLCEKCLELMKSRGIDSCNAAARREFTRGTYLAMASDISAAVREINPEYLLYFNGIDYRGQSGISSYLDFECIPTKSGCDYEYLPLIARHMRTLGNRPMLNMTGRFHLWGDFGGLRPETAIRQELLTGLANCMRPNIGDHLAPDGRLCAPAMRQAANVFSYLHKRDEWFDGAEALADTAICFPRETSTIRTALELRGAARMLCELHSQFDVVDAEADWSRYSLMVLPDTVKADSPGFASKLQKWIAAGGKIISSGDSGLDGNSEFLPEWPVKFEKVCDFSPAYFRENGMDWSIYVPEGNLVKPAAGAESRIPLVRPQVNYGWDGLYPEYYNPPMSETEKNPFLTVGANGAHFSHMIFSGYKRSGHIALRNVFERVLHELQRDPLLKVSGLPHFARATMTRQASGRTIVHLLGHIPEHRTTGGDVIEDDLIVPACVLSLKCAGTKAYLAPERHELECGTAADGRLEIKVPQFTGYAMIVVE